MPAMSVRVHVVRHISVRSSYGLVVHAEVSTRPKLAWRSGIWWPRMSRAPPWRKWRSRVQRRRPTSLWQLNLRQPHAPPPRRALPVTMNPPPARGLRAHHRARFQSPRPQPVGPKAMPPAVAATVPVPKASEIVPPCHGGSSSG